MDPAAAARWGAQPKFKHVARTSRTAGTNDNLTGRKPGPGRWASRLPAASSVALLHRRTHRQFRAGDVAVIMA